jgi:hypothetical protein
VAVTGSGSSMDIPFNDLMEWKSMEYSMTPVEWNRTNVYDI